MLRPSVTSPGREHSYSSWRDVTLCRAGASAAP
jgi:hypothetical protein